MLRNAPPGEGSMIRVKRLRSGYQSDDDNDDDDPMVAETETEPTPTRRGGGTELPPTQLHNGVELSCH